MIVIELSIEINETNELKIMIKALATQFHVKIEIRLLTYI